MLTPVGAFGANGGAAIAAGADADMSSRWKARMADLRQDPSVVRLYVFDQARDGGEPIAGLGRSAAPLTWALTPLPGAPEERFTVVEGMVPGTKAIRLDRGVLSADPVVFRGKAMTVELWFRKNGHGALRGNGAAANGTLVSVGNGYWDGWRVTTSYPEQTFGFEIGRPAPQGSAGFFQCGPLPDGVWHHLAATWDGKEMRLYLNGSLAGAMAYDGAMLPGDRLRIGYANAGWGSVKLDVQVMIVRDRPIEAGEALRMAMFHADVTAGYLSRWGDAEAARLRRDHSHAAQSYEALVGMAGIHPDLAAIARLRLADVQRVSGRMGTATASLAAIVADGRVSDRFRMTALGAILSGDRTVEGSLPTDTLRKLANRSDIPASRRAALRRALARSLMAANRTQDARKEYIGLMEETRSAQERQSLRLEMAHAMRMSGKHAEARRQYAALAEEADASPALRSSARLLAAGTLLEEKRYDHAAAAFRKLASQTDAPLAERYEAAEALREIERIKKGRTPHDPAASRVKLPAAMRPGLELCVAPTGSDSAPGTTARPLKSLQGALARLRELRRRGPLPKGGAAVTFASGRYPIGQTVEMSQADSGLPGAPVVFRAAPGADVRFTGGQRITGLQPVTDAALLGRMPEPARSRVRQIDLRAAGIGDPGRLAPRGVGFGSDPVPELFWNGAPLTLARWPNDGWLRTGDIVEERNAAGGFTFACSDERMARWSAEPDAWLYGYWGWLWADHGVRAASFDAANGRIATAQIPSYAPRAGMPWFIYNALSELDAPGEWFLDSARGIVIVFPPSDPDRAVIEYAELSSPFLKLDNVSHVRFERLGFELGRSNGIEITGGSNVLVAGCRIGKLRGSGVLIDGGRNHGVFGCELHTLGRNGTSVKGGDRKTLAASGHFVENCHIHHFSRWDRTYTPAVYAEGVGIRIAHNLIHDSPGHAMRIEGNDHVIEFNEVHHVVTETDDQGGLDMWFNPTYRGVVIRHNFWHHIGGDKDDMMRAGIRLDDAICGVLIYGNVFWKASEGLFGGVQIHGGKENEVVNNLFVDCKYGISFSRWGPERWKQYTAGEPFLKATRHDVDIASPPYSTRYPALARLGDRPDVNTVARNLAINCGEFLTRDGGIEDVADNVVLAGDAGVVVVTGGRLQLNPGSTTMRRFGMRPLLLSEMGRYPHGLAVGTKQKRPPQ